MQIRNSSIAKKAAMADNMRNSDEAVVGIVVTVLLIGLMLAVIVMVNTVYVPQWLEESEAAHMEDVSNSFAQLKYALDIQSLVNDSTSISTSVTLGSRELPIFTTGRTFGSLEIADNSFNLTVDRWNNTNVSYVADSIKYSSGNSYFVNQQYIYEAGALILAQDDANVLFGKPALSVSDYGNNSTIRFTIANVSGVSGKTFVSGYGIYPIYTQVLDVKPYFNGYFDMTNVTNITIYTKYTNAWNRSIYSAFLNHLNESHYDLFETVNEKIAIKFKNTSSDSPDEYYHLQIRVVDFSAQISSGIAE
jgi:hypothetical protein